MSETLSIFLAAGAVFLVGYLYGADFERYSIFTVGVFERVTHQPAKLDGECREHWCDAHAGDGEGEHRRWFKEIVVLGFPVAEYADGYGYYCAEHADVSIQLGEYEETRSVPDSVVWAIVWVAEKFVTDVDRPEESEFENVQSDLSSSVGDAFALIPIVVLVLSASVVLKTMDHALPGEVDE